MQNTMYGSISNGHSIGGQASSSYPPSATSVSGDEGDVHAQSVNGVEEATAGPSTETNGYGHYIHPHDADVVAHLYNVGFRMGNYSDVIIETPYAPYRLHSLVIHRSPYIAHLMSITPNPPRNGMIPIFRVPLENFPEITNEGFTIALGYLYSSMSLHGMSPANARAVLAAGCLLGGMDDLCQYAYEMCRDSISLETLDEWLAFVNSLSLPDGTSSPHEVSMPHHYAPRLRSDVFDFLVVDLRAILEVQKPGSNGRETLLHILARIPFDFFKSAIESPSFKIGSDQERFHFAKAAIDLRKRARGGGVEETVVLAFGGAASSGSAVHVTRKTKKRPLFKVG